MTVAELRNLIDALPGNTPIVVSAPFATFVVVDVVLSTALRYGDVLGYDSGLVQDAHQRVPVLVVS